MSPRFFETSVTLSPLVVALASIASLDLLPAGPVAAPQAATAMDAWQACHEQHAAGAHHPPAARGDRTQWPAWRRDAEAAVERCLRERLAPAATARRVRPAGAAA